MKNSLLTILSRHQIMLSVVIVGIFIASGAFVSTKYFDKQIATVVSGKCSPQTEVDAQKAQLADLNAKASSTEAEISQTENDIVANSSSITTAKKRIDTLKTLIQSDYALSLENENVTRLCPASGAEANPECTAATRNYSNLLKDNEAKKKELKDLEAKVADPNVSDGTYFTDLLDKKKNELAGISSQISDLNQAIAFSEANVCPTDETNGGINMENCSNTDSDGNDIDDDNNGQANCADSVCASSPICK